LARNCLDGELSARQLCGVKQPRILWDGAAEFDPTSTLAVHCGDGFDADFSPYRRARLNR
jgi:hypothetical protein